MSEPGFLVQDIPRRQDLATRRSSDLSQKQVSYGPCTWTLFGQLNSDADSTSYAGN